MGTKNVPGNVAFIKRLFNRDTYGNDTLYIQQGHAADISKLSQKELNDERKALGYHNMNSLEGKRLQAQYHATH